MSEQWTPGPWSCKRTGDGKRYIIGAGQSAWGTHVAEVYADDTDADEAAANAALVKSAPDLYARLKLLVDTIEAHEIESLSCDRDGNKWCECLQENAAKAKAALKKAVGE